MAGLAPLEYNYFELNNINLFIPPFSVIKSSGNLSADSTGCFIYQKVSENMQKKDSPLKTLRALTKQEADRIWMKMNCLLWPGICEDDLSGNQKMKVSQLFYHFLISESSESASFLTIDKHLFPFCEELNKSFGICISSPQEAWATYKPMYDLYTPDENEINRMWQHQHYYLGNLFAEIAEINQF
jgi:hypothetical protein